MNQKIAIYGAGEFGKIFYQALNDKVDFFIDDYTTNESFQNIPIKKLSEVTKETKIYISPLQYSNTIEKSLKDSGFTNIVNFTNTIKQLSGILEIVAKTNYLWLVEDKNQMMDKEKLNKVFTLLKDEKSIQLLKQIILLRETLDNNYYITPEGIEYFPEDIPMFENLDDVNFIDCGAYIGDTIVELLQQTQNVNYTISFEPDTKNLTKLQSELENLKKKNSNTNFIIYPAGVYSTNDILKFSNNGIDSSASLDNNSTLEVPVVSLDTVVLNSAPNFIKMDIEGAEKEALIGATKTIKKYKPNLAICLYHKPEDLWELPLLINEIEPSYDMYIRVHEDMCLSTVLYCISKDRKDV
jgi:FkbM family methyltransferase